MTRSRLISILGLACSMACGPKVQVQTAAPDANAVAEREVSEAAAHRPTALPSPAPTTEGTGTCRIYGHPSDFDANGLQIEGAFPGELQGEVIADNLDYVPALRACVDDSTCAGVTSDWYIDTPFRLVRAGGVFHADDDSYACTTLITGRP